MIAQVFDGGQESRGNRPTSSASLPRKPWLKGESRDGVEGSINLVNPATGRNLVIIVFRDRATMDAYQAYSNAKIAEAEKLTGAKVASARRVHRGDRAAVARRRSARVRAALCLGTRPRTRPAGTACQRMRRDPGYGWGPASRRRAWRCSRIRSARSGVLTRTPIGISSGGGRDVEDADPGNLSGLVTVDLV